MGETAHHFKRGRLTLVLGVLLAGCVEPPDIAPLEEAVVARAVRVDTSLAQSSFGKAVAKAVLNSPTLGRSEAAVAEAAP